MSHQRHDRRRASTLARAYRMALSLPAAFLSTACVQQPRAVLGSGEAYLGPRFQSGRVMVYEFAGDVATTWITGDSKQELGARHTQSTMRIAVNKVHADGSAELIMTYDRLVVSGPQSDGTSYVFDSRQEQPDPDTDTAITDALRLLAQSKVTFHADARGEVDLPRVNGTTEACNEIKSVNAIQDRVVEFNPAGLADLFESTMRVGPMARVHDIDHPWREVVAWPVVDNDHRSLVCDFTPVEQDAERVIIDMSLHLESVPNYGFRMREGQYRYIWDLQRSEVIECTGTIEYEWDMPGADFFQYPEPVQRCRVITSVRRVDG